MSLCSFKTSRLKKIYRKLPERNKKFVFKRKKKKVPDARNILFKRCEVRYWKTTKKEI